MQAMMIETDEHERAIAPKVMDDLPEWSGIPESTQVYIRESAGMPFFQPWRRRHL